MGIKTIVMVALMGCGSDGAPGPAGDAPAAGDGPSGDGGITAGNVTCDQVHTTTITGANNSTTVNHNYSALVAGIDPSRDEWALELCDLVFTSNGTSLISPNSCGTTANCVDSGAPNPIAKCQWNYRVGSFAADGKLIVSCGSDSQTKDSGGNVTSSTEFRYGTIRVHH